MVNRSELCEKISEIYPQLGSCERNMVVQWDAANRAWAVDFELGGEKVRHFLEDADAAACVLGRQCVGVGIEFGQFL
ncbi:hypothetical protein DSCA_34090 [Desulfosarcina alkanivorans]|uniref:Uncharacterized protein n=2 Tax=Desulfosarcina alkanivorans TaxID=571177 RepID=A0A5K7YNN1_9BACT|nr:hypothetical protein DSCA_34090 [Desulfosarcina alkanivorans]